MKKGIDISRHQGNINFAQVKSSGIEFIIAREGYRNTTDSKFFEYIRMAKEAGLNILGVYHFSYALNEKEAIQEAKFCIDNMKSADLGPDVMVFFDFEYDTVTKAAQKGVVLTKEECNKHTIAFCEEVRKLGYTPGVYTNKDYYKNWYTKDTLNRYLIWLADYSGGPDFDCLIQQYTSKGKVPGISGNVDMNYFYGDFKMKNEIKYYRQKVVDLANSWVGKKESDGSYKEIIDIYNSFTGPFPRGVKMQYGWPWCACTWSALSIALGYTSIMPIEISCGELIKKAKEMGIWIENDSYKPLPGDGIIYDWGDNGVGDNQGWPDHIGVVVAVVNNQIRVVEGNKSNEVGIRIINLNGKFIRGFINPKYTEDKIEIQIPIKSVDEIAKEVISGLWGNGTARKEAITKAGYNYDEVQSMVNQIIKDRHKEQVLSAACHVILGEYDVGDLRKSKIESLGLNYDEVMTLVNKIIAISKE